MRLVLLLSTVVSLAFATDHKLRLAEDELVQYFGILGEATHEVPEYEIVYINRVTSAKTLRMLTREIIKDHEISFKFRAFDDELDIEVAKEKDFFTEQTASCMYLEDDGTEKREDIPRDCYYSGTVKGHSKSKVSVNTCGGMTGTISRQGYEDVYIEPLRRAHAHKRGMDSELGHVIYKAPRDIGMWECGVSENDHNTVRQIVNITTSSFVPEQKYLKLHIVADHFYWAKNGAESCYCITATFQALAHRMALLPSLNMLLARVTIMKTNTILDTISTVAGTNLVLTRTWTDNHPEKAQWDHVALVVPQYMDVAGVAWGCSVCGYNKITVSYIGALYGVQVMAHEIGHNLCLSHDYGAFNSGRHGYVMGAAGWDTQEMGWSQYSLQKYLANINKFTCLGDQ